MQEDRVFIGLGANLGMCDEHIRQAFEDLDKIPGTHVLARSSLYRTAPLGKLDQPDFINAVVRLSTALPPDELLGQLLLIEQRHGRIRTEKNGPRTLDLDLLLYGDRIDKRRQLTLPHPRMHARAFVLLPLSEIAPECEIPGLGPIAHLLADVTDQGVKRIDAA